MTRDADVIVVGGGPVGLAAAIDARLHGLSVVVVEPRVSTIDKACGEGLMPGALPLLSRLGIAPHGMPLRGVQYRSATKRVEHRFVSGAGLGVRRLTLHDALSARATELGVERAAARVTTIEQDDQGVHAAGLSGSWLVGADGLHSTVRRATGLERASGRRKRFGVRQHFAVEPWSDLIEVHWNGDVEAYVTPVSERVVGVALLGGAPVDFAKAVAAIPALAAKLAEAEAASALRGAGPFRQRAIAPASGRVLLAGDASGYVDAITGEGLRLGFDQARAALAAIASGDVTGYPREWRRITRDFRVLTSALVAAAGSPLRVAIVPAAVTLPRIFGGVVERLAR